MRAKPVLLITLIIIALTFSLVVKQNNFFKAAISSNTFSSLSKKQSGIEIGNRAPNFTLPSVENRKVSLSSLRGKVVLLNFWASWCAPCISELPTLNKLANQNKDVEVVGVNLTFSENNSNDLKLFAKNNQLVYKVLLDLKGTIKNEYNVFALPTTFIINKYGEIVTKLYGPLSFKKIDNILDTLN